MGMCDSSIGESLRWPEGGLAFQLRPSLAYARLEWVHSVCAAYLAELRDADRVYIWRCGNETVRFQLHDCRFLGRERGGLRMYECTNTRF